MAYFKNKLQVTVDLGSNASEADMSSHNTEIIEDLTRYIKDFFINKDRYEEIYTDYEKSEKVDISCDVSIIEQTSH